MQNRSLRWTIRVRSLTDGPDTWELALITDELPDDEHVLMWSTTTTDLPAAFDTARGLIVTDLIRRNQG